MDFYFHFVVPNRSLIELGRSVLVPDTIRSQFSRYVSAWWGNVSGRKRRMRIDLFMNRLPKLENYRS